MSIRAIHGDCLALIPQLAAEGVTVDAVVTDPPYGLEFMGQEWDKFRVNSGSRWSKKVATGKDWQGVERERPGRLYMRSMHKTCKKCRKQSHQHDNIKCNADYELIVHKPLQMHSFQAWSEEWARAAYDILKPGGFLLAFGGTRTHHRLACAIEDAGFVIQDCLMWLFGTGFPKNKAHLKPAYEPIILAYKPGGKRTMQIDECRVGTETRINPPTSPTANRVAMGQGWRPDAKPTTAFGRWPASIVHDESDEVVALFPQSKSTGGQASLGAFRNGDIYGKGRDVREKRDPGFGDTGSAARFFFSAKAGSEDRWGSRHPTVKPVALMKWLVQLVTPPHGIVLDPFAGSGTTGVAALATGRNAILMEREEQYYNDIRERIAFYEGGGLHSTQAKARRRATPGNAMPLFEASP